MFLSFVSYSLIISAILVLLHPNFVSAQTNLAKDSVEASQADSAVSFEAVLIDRSLGKFAARGTGDSGGGAGIIDIPQDRWEKFIREYLPAYSEKSQRTSVRDTRRLMRQIILFSFMYSGYRPTDYNLYIEGSDVFNSRLHPGSNGLVEQRSRERFREALKTSPYEWTTRSFAEYGARQYPILNTRYTRDFFAIAIRLLKPELTSDQLKAEIERAMQSDLLPNSIGNQQRAEQRTTELQELSFLKLEYESAVILAKSSTDRAIANDLLNNIMIKTKNLTPPPIHTTMDVMTIQLFIEELLRMRASWN